MTGTDGENTYTWQGREVPLWSFEHWKHMEDFLDDLCPPEYIAQITYELHHAGLVTGFFYSKEPLIPAHVVAAYYITDPEPEPGFEDET